MTRIQITNEQRAADWPYSQAQMEQILAAVRQEAYPPARRDGIGPAVRVVRS